MGLPPARAILTLAALSVAYFAAAKVGLAFAYVNASASAIWPAAGISLAALLVLGYRVWPAILVGAFVANLSTHGSIAASFGIAVGNTLEGLTGAYLVNRFANGRQFVDYPRHIFAFAGLGAIASSTLAAGMGVASLALANLVPRTDMAMTWLTWWLGDTVGILVVTPFIVLWSRTLHFGLDTRRAMEACALVLGVSIVSYFVFHGFTPRAGAQHLPLAFLNTPFLLWAAFRFGRRGVATTLLIVACIAIWGTLLGLGPLHRTSPNESLLLLQAHLGVAAMTMLCVGAVVWQLRQSESRTLEMAFTDPLTGLANYRRLVTALSDGIERSERSDRPLAVLLLDMDGLKGVNDGHGHLAGNRALVRIAEALRASVRSTDTVVRFGGDEFACVLPYTSDAGAEELAHRLAAQLTLDLEQPRISVSLGWAVYPRDGESAEQLLSVADDTLYAAKTRRHSQSIKRAVNTISRPNGLSRIGAA
jgi:diguanylate cyclase (GGDEF)-like protein